MFRKVKVNKSKLTSIKLEEKAEKGENVPVLNLREEDNEKQEIDDKKSSSLNIERIKSEIDKKFLKKRRKGIEIKELEKDERLYVPFKKEESRESTVKKNFVSESEWKEAKNPDEKKKILGIKKEEIDRMREENKRGLIEMQKELFTLPENLQAHPSTKNDHVENLLKLSTAGLIEVPLTLEQKLKSIEEREDQRAQRILLDNKLAEELDYLKVLKKIGPSYAKGYKSDLSQKKISQLNNVFQNVFVGENSRKRKLLREKVIEDNRRMEGEY